METLEIRTRIAAEVVIRIALEADGPRVLDIDIGAVTVERTGCATHGPNGLRRHHQARTKRAQDGSRGVL